MIKSIIAFTPQNNDERLFCLISRCQGTWMSFMAPHPGKYRPSRTDAGITSSPSTGRADALSMPLPFTRGHSGGFTRARMTQAGFFLP